MTSEISETQHRAGHGYQFRPQGELNRRPPLYATPPRLYPAFDGCHFYHVMDLPGFGTTDGHWDLRGHADEYLGNVDFAGKSVLEIGPASGFLTSEMEKRGAAVVAVEVTDNPGWDFVFYPEHMLAPLRPQRRIDMQRLKDSFWFVHKLFNLNAKLHYGDAYNLPPELGRFDIAVLAAVLLHTKSPHLILAECAKFADTIIVTEMLHSDIEHCGPVMRLVPDGENFIWHTWWHFTTAFFIHAFNVLGFHKQTITYHEQMMTSQSRAAEYFTVVASRPKVI